MQYLQLHAPKTGGTWLRHQTEGLANWLRPGHGEGAALVAKHPDRVVVGTVRDPWGWYESAYIHAINGNGYNQQAVAMWAGEPWELGVNPQRVVWEPPRFRAFVYGCTHPGSINIRDTCRYAGLQMRLPRGWPEIVRRRGIGLCTMVHEYSYGIEARWRDGEGEAYGLLDVVLRTDSLVRDAKRLGLEVDAERRNTRGSRMRFHAPDLTDAWDDEMRAWVLEADGGDA